MSVQKLISKSLSILFRIIIILFGLLIVKSRDNYFDFYWYLIIIVPYVVIYFLTLFKDGWYSKVRLLNDFCFIVFFLFGKEIDFTTVSFLVLPILNSPNYSGIKKSFLLYIFLILSLFIVSDFIFSWSFIYVTVVFYLINFIADSRKRYFENITNLNTEIESFFEKVLHKRNTFKIYSGILNVLNKIHVLVLYKPEFEKIVCFKIKEKEITLENSSTFVWSYSIETQPILESLKKDNSDAYYNSNLELVINDVLHYQNLFLHSKTDRNHYLFVFTIKRNSNQLFNLYYISILRPVVARLARVIDLENAIKTENISVLKTFRDKYFYMQNAEKAMHFIRNRFNTLDNFIEMSKDNIAGNMDTEGMEIYSTELERLERNYQLLLSRVKNILNKSAKPFSTVHLEPKSSKYYFKCVRDIWLSYFKEFNHELNWDLINIDQYTIQVNDDGLYILLTDWINNISRHSIGNEAVIFNEEEESLVTIFRNDFSAKSKSEIETLASDFNSTDRDRILQRTSHGVIIMKSIIEEMRFKGEIKVDGNCVEFVMTIKKEAK